ncbi:MAG: hypothetical protein H6672_17725 [Anaerolineaceae bacterium]|nr:hypothetical protein [Anaerolineaceae bacterium]
MVRARLTGGTGLLAAVRWHLLAAFRSMTLEDFRRPAACRNMTRRRNGCCIIYASMRPNIAAN